MKESIGKNYFVVGKLLSLIIFMGYVLFTSQEDAMMKAFQGMLVAFFMVFSVLQEITDRKKNRIIQWIFEGILAILGVFLFPVLGSLLGVIAITDLCSVLERTFFWYCLAYGMVFIYGKNTGKYGTGILLTSAILFLYYQEKIIISRYRSILGQEEETQIELKTDIERQNKTHQKEIEKSHLQFENEMLQDRNRISQALHDKLGHSINGSLYQLEAAKLLVEKKPEDCQKILQGVIDQLRVSMDEIRLILRREKPDKKRMAFLALHSLCEECETKYQIHTELQIEDEEGTIPEKIWEIILDNTYEAVTNALKYAQCRNITIHIVALNQVVRCTIKDDGRGAANMEEGMGIAGMKNRVRAVKGFIDIESEFGFTINMILPIGE